MHVMDISLFVTDYMIMYTSVDAHILTISAPKNHPRITKIFSCQSPESETGIDQ